MSAIHGKKIAIVGGGPGGLTLARPLQQSGAQVSVHERDRSRSARVQGSALDLHEDSGLAALDAAGLMEAFWANHRPDLDSLRLTDTKGTVLHEHLRRMSGPGKRPEIERGPLRDLLLESLRPPPPCSGIASWSLQSFRTSRSCYGLRTDRPQLLISPLAATAQTLACVSWSLLSSRSMSEFRS
jgi:2-polyprenyl-6-methoxyphenol hydroxylase-like FAD-dependent oxidoreductase